MVILLIILSVSKYLLPVAETNNKFLLYFDCVHDIEKKM